MLQLLGEGLCELQMEMVEPLVALLLPHFVSSSILQYCSIAILQSLHVSEGWHSINVFNGNAVVV